MLDPQAALAGAAHPAALPRRAWRRALVLGGAGALGSAVVEHLLAGHRFERVGVLARLALQPALRGLVPVVDDETALAAFAADTALIVFDRERRANGRDAAFVRLAPDELLARARQLRAAGVRHLIVVVPHSTAQLPQALKLGLASLDEGAVAALGFEHLVFMRMAQAAASGGAGSLPHRLAGWMLSQLLWLVPQHEQPVRGVTVARVAAALALALPGSTPATRVLPPDVLWLAAQQAQAGDLIAAWLAGKTLPAAPLRQRW